MIANASKMMLGLSVVKRICLIMKEKYKFNNNTDVAWNDIWRIRRGLEHRKAFVDSLVILMENSRVVLP